MSFPALGDIADNQQVLAPAKQSLGAVNLCDQAKFNSRFAQRRTLAETGRVAGEHITVPASPS
jgi:hypothetical protein